MDTFDFCPDSQVAETTPRDPMSVVSMNGWTFTSKPTVPHAHKFKVTLHGLKWITDELSGLYLNAVNPTINARRLEEFYNAHETWDPFYYPHPHLGTLVVRFAAPVIIPAAIPNSDGLCAALEINLIEHDPGY